MENNIVITGIGLISKLGYNMGDFWHNRKSNQTANNSNKGSTMPIEDFEPKQFLKRKLIKNLDTVTRFCIAAIGTAQEDSNLEIDKSKIGIVAGSVYNGIFSIFDVKDAYCQGGITNVSPLYFPGTVFNASAAQAAIEWKITGPNCTVNSGTSSGLSAIVKGVQYLQLDKAKAMICGGNEMLFDYIISNYNFLNQLSPTKDGFKPFDDNGEGMILGEGACYFTLETDKDAYDRGSKIYAKILSYFQNFNPDQNDPVSSIVECISNTIVKDDCDYRDEIDLIVVDGSGIPENDKLIISAIEKVFYRKIPYLTTNRSSLGNTLGASGAFNLLEGILSIQNGEICPIYNIENPIKTDIPFVREITRKEINKVLITSFDPNGNNSCILISK